MRIHRLQLTNVKGIADRVVDFPERGVIVIEGANEAGKTSMLEALDLLLEEKDSSRKRHVLAARPVGRDVGTTVEAELSTGAYRFRYRKQWFRTPTTELHVLSPRVEHLAGVPAHDRVVQILAETADLTLWRALRLMQATPLAQVALGGSRKLAAALDAAAAGALTVVPAGAGAAGALGREGTNGRAGTGGRDGTGGREADSAEAEGLLAAAESEHARYFTAAKGQPAGEYREALDAVEATRRTEREAAAAVAEVTDDVRRHEACLEESAHARDALVAAEFDLADMEATWAEVSGLLERHDAAERETAAADRERGRALEREGDRRRLREELDARREDMASLQRKVAVLGEELGRDDERLSAVLAERRAATEAVRGCEAELAAAERAETAGRRAAQRHLLRERCARAEEAEGQRRCAVAELSRSTVDEATVRALEHNARAVDVAVAQQDADSARVTIVGLADGRRLLIDGREVHLDTGAEHVQGLAEPVDVTIPGQVTLRLRPESAAGERAAQVGRAREALAEALAAAGVRDVDEARDRLEQRRLLQDGLARATERLADLLAGSSVAELKDALAELDDAGDDVPLSEGVEPVGAQPLEVLRAGLAAAREAQADLTARGEALRGAVEETRVAHTRADSLLGAAHREVGAAQERLCRARTQESDEALTASSVAAAAEAARLGTALGALRQRLAEVDAEGTQRLLAAARSRATVCRERVARLRDERLAIEARLEHSGRQGRYDAWEAARGALQLAERRLASVARRAEAARLLHQTLQAHRAEATRRYVEPFAAAVHRLGSVVYGPGFAVEVDEDLAVAARVIDGIRIEYEALSTGAKEQLAILSRLAVATLVDADDGVPVVIDDALGYTDPVRLRRMAAAFSRVGDDAQVILLTCTPGRYDGIVGAQIVRVDREPAAAPCADVG